MTYFEYDWNGEMLEEIGEFRIDKVWKERNGKRIPGTTAYAVTTSDEYGNETGTVGDFKTLKEARAEIRKFL